MSKITLNWTRSKSHGIFNFRFLLKIHFKANGRPMLFLSINPSLPLCLLHSKWISSNPLNLLLCCQMQFCQLNVFLIQMCGWHTFHPMKRWYSNQFQLKRHQNTFQIDIRSNSMNIYSFRLLSSKCLRRQITVSLNASTNMKTIHRIDSIQIEKHLPSKRSANCFSY